MTSDGILGKKKMLQRKYHFILKTSSRYVLYGRSLTIFISYCYGLVFVCMFVCMCYSFHSKTIISFESKCLHASNDSFGKTKSLKGHLHRYSECF